jgi:adenylate kinase family enzyme
MPNRDDRPPTRNRAVLLFGPTGSGKTPLGDLMAERGLWKARCLHFDFGSHLRSIVRRNRPDRLVSQEDIDFLRRVLEAGALLEDEQFPLAERILRSYLAEHGADCQTVVILNGLPRHVGQAQSIDLLLDVRAVIHLRCSPETVLQRIGNNAGGDRAGRWDDDPASIRSKLAIFAARTAPLVEHYRDLGANVATIDVTPTITAQQVWEVLEGRI